MDRRTRRRIEMAKSVMGFPRNRPELGAALTPAVGQLDERLHKVEEIAARELEGVRTRRAASERKVELRRSLRGTHLAHLGQVGKAASREIPDLAQKFVFR